MLKNKTAVALLIAFSVMVPDGAFAATSDVQGYGYGGGRPRTVTVCYITNTSLLPYIKMRVPYYVAGRWLHANPPRAIMPNPDGSCGSTDARPPRSPRPWFWDYLFSWTPSIDR